MSGLRESLPTRSFFGPLTVERTASGPKIGYVVSVFLPDGERVEIRTSRTGRSGLQVRHILWSSATDTKEPQ